MNKNDSLGDRMERYESVSKSVLISRMPVIIRLDGKAFHTFTRGFAKPFDDVMTAAMQHTMLSLSMNIQGCVFGYTQSDEITLILVDYKTLNTSSWFDNEVQKICSVSASMATMFFNRYFANMLQDEIITDEKSKVMEIYKAHKKAMERGAMFDARCFNVPKEDVCNCLIWRQKDAIRNSIQAAGQSVFSHSELNEKSCEDIKKMLLSREIDWNDYSLVNQRGTCVRVMTEHMTENGASLKYVLDKEIPLFTEDRAYIEDLIMVGD